MYSIKKAWIKIRILLFNKIFIDILIKYYNYNNILLAKNIIKFL